MTVSAARSGLPHRAHLKVSRSAADALAVAQRGGRLLGLLRRDTPTRRRAGELLAALPWLIMAVAAAVSLVINNFSAGRTPQWLLVSAIAVLFPVLLVRLALTALLRRRGRPARLVLLGAILLWAAGSARLNATDQVTTVVFPSSNEAFFVPAYLLLAAFLFLDLPHASVKASSTWLESVIVLGGAVCLIAFVVFTPLAGAFDATGPALVLALFYPMLDVILASIVVSQMALRQRSTDRPAVALVAGFGCLLVADLLLVASLADSPYASSLAAEALYGVGFALLVAGACARNLARPLAATQRGNALVAAAAAVGLVVIVVRPASTGLWYVTLPAVATLVAAGFRLVIALREAQTAVEARRLSLTDDLTGLANRRALLARVQDAITSHEPIGLLLFDLDGFKDVNDSLGHGAGDAVLCEVADRLVEVVPGGSLVARLGGDEFAVVMRKADPVNLMTVAHGAREALMSPPVHVEGLDITVRASIGASSRSEADVRAVDLVRRADVAMYEAKAKRVGAVLYSSDRDAFTRERLELAEQLRDGIASGQLEAWYQPQVDTHTMRVDGVEALVRWRHPVRGIMSPIEFLPIARRAGLMPALTQAMVAIVVADARRWWQQGRELRVSFNCAPPELLGPALLPALFAAIDQANLPPDSMLVEVTEDSFVADPELARETLVRLRDHHVQTAIDDYGTGFSSLSYLRDLPVQELKIDRSFVSTMLTDPRSRVIVDSTRQMAHAMGLRLVAEGVEDDETIADLARLDVDILQGYRISRPLPVVELDLWLSSWLPQTSGATARIDVA